MGAMPDLGSSSSVVEVEEQTQTDDTTKPEEQEVESQLCAEVSSVSLDEHEQERSDSRRGERDDSAHASCVVGEGMEIDDSPLSSPMRMDFDVPIKDLTRESTPQTGKPPVAGTEDTASDTPAYDVEMEVDAQTFYGEARPPYRPRSKKKSRVSAPAKLEGCSNGGDSGGDGEVTTPKT